MWHVLWVYASHDGIRTQEASRTEKTAKCAFSWHCAIRHTQWQFRKNCIVQRHVITTTVTFLRTVTRFEQNRKKRLWTNYINSIMKWIDKRTFIVFTPSKAGNVQRFSLSAQTKVTCVDWRRLTNQKRQSNERIHVFIMSDHKQCYQHVPINAEWEKIVKLRSTRTKHSIRR